MAQYGLKTEITEHLAGMQFGGSRSDTGGGYFLFDSTKVKVAKYYPDKYFPDYQLIIDTEECFRFDIREYVYSDDSIIYQYEDIVFKADEISMLINMASYIYFLSDDEMKRCCDNLGYSDKLYDLVHLMSREQLPNRHKFASDVLIVSMNDSFRFYTYLEGVYSRSSFVLENAAYRGKSLSEDEINFWESKLEGLQWDYLEGENIWLIPTLNKEGYKNLLDKSLECEKLVPPGTPPFIH